MINLVMLLCALSIVAERLGNVLKLELAQPRESRRARERRVQRAVLGASIVLSFLLKADFFAIMSQPQAPWETLGWMRPSDDGWVLNPAAASWATVLHATVGTVLTGIAMGFGSKFWHEVLHLVRSASTARR